MGNVLCKEPNTNPTQSTGNTFGNLSSIICPNGLGKSKAQPMRKTYFSRSAVDASKKTTTAATGWQSVGLHVPEAAPTVIDTPPVAPPRKKRGATLDGRYRSDESLQVRNGFQDVFGRDGRRHSCDISTDARAASVPAPRPETAALPARQTSCFEIDASNDAFSDFSKVPTTAELEKHPSTSQVSRVGNRKSDKFFGERLADSLSPLQQELEANEANDRQRAKRNECRLEDVDRIEKFVERDTQDEVAPVVEPASENRTTTAGASEAAKESTPDDSSATPGDSNANGEDLMKYIDRTVSADNQIGRRAEFLMAMLEDYNDSARYDGMHPVEEPLIVPKRRKNGHICDDPDHLHTKLHEHERNAAGVEGREATAPPRGNVIRTEASIELAPRKPSRDFSKYKPIEADSPGAIDSDGEQSAAITRPTRMKKKSSSSKQQREGLPTPPSPPSPLPKFQKSLSESQFDQQLVTDAPPSSPVRSGEDSPPKAHTPRMLKRIISMPATEHLGKESATASTRPETPPRPVLSKSSSSGSFTAIDLQRTRISVERFTPEDYAHHSGLDELVKPKSKLTTRKISWKSNEQPCSRTPTPTQERPDNPSFTIGGSAVVTTGNDTLSPPAAPRRKRSDTSTEPPEPTADRSEQQAPQDRETSVSAAKMYQQLYSKPEDSSLRKFCLGSFIESSHVLQHHDVVNVLDRVYTASDNQENIIEQFQLFLEQQLNDELNEPNPVNPNVAKLLEKLSRTDSTTAAPTVGDGDKLENVTIELVSSSRSGSSSSRGKSSDVDDCFDPEFEKIEKSEIVFELPKIEHLNPKHAGANSGRRRDSIEYMSDWFGGGDSDGSTSMLSAAGEERTIDARSPEGVGIGRKGLHLASERRESIEDVGRWFSNHNILRPSFGEEFEEPSRRLRRGSDSFLGYDLQRQYPFGMGRQRSDSLSAEMFEDITKLHEQKQNTDESTPTPGGIVPPPHKRKVLEHRNSSDALLIKVLNKPLLAQHGTPTPGSAEKLNDNAPRPVETETYPVEATATTSSEENEPLLKPDERQQPSVEGTAKGVQLTANGEKGQVAAARQLATSGTALSNDGKDEQHQQEQQQQQLNEHSTLLKFLSKEQLIE